MTSDPLRLDAIIQAVADGEPIDWNALRTRGDDRERRLLDHLRLLADVGEAHQTTVDQPPTPGGPGPGASGDRESWGHLLLIEPLGAGGFGEVFRARDPWLDREVALKLLKSDVADRTGAGHILSEARTLARLRHTNVVCIYGADVHDGRVGLWMELIKGQTLADIVAAQGTRSAREAAVVGQEVCRAVSAVHAAGIVHRDIKAQNVMREADGRVVLMDFGPGATPICLAPEVLAGGPLTVASDVYAIGVLLYFLVSGRYPVSGSSTEIVADAHARGDRRRLADQRGDLPDEFVAIVERALSPDPRTRYQTAGELLEALAGRAAASSSRFTGAGQAPADRSIAVLPFADLSADRRLGYLCEGIAEEIISALMKVTGVRVVARSSAFRFSDRSLDPGRVGSQLDVRSVLEGSVRALGDRLRIVVRLVDTSDGSQVWTEQLDARLDDVFAVQERIASAVVRALGLGVSASDDDATGVAPAETARDFDAYALYLKGRHCWNQRTEKTLHRSVEYFLEALKRQPRYPAALAGLAEAYTTLGLYGVQPPHEIMPQATEAAARAIDLDPTLSSPHATAACIAAVYDWDWSAAAGRFEHAIALNPREPVAHHWYAIHHLVPLGEFDTARRELQQAAAADPLSMSISLTVGLTSYFGRDFERARREIDDTLELAPGASAAHLFLGLTLVELGHYGDAVREIETAERLSPSPEMTAALGYAFGRSGQRDRARAALEALHDLATRRYISPSLPAQVLVALGEATSALDTLARSVSLHAADLAWLGVRPVFDDLRSEPRFRGFLNAIGLVAG